MAAGLPQGRCVLEVHWLETHMLAFQLYGFNPRHDASILKRLLATDPEGRGLAL